MRSPLDSSSSIPWIQQRQRHRHERKHERDERRAPVRGEPGSTRSRPASGSNKQQASFHQEIDYVHAKGQEEQPGHRVDSDVLVDAELGQQQQHVQPPVRDETSAEEQFHPDRELEEPLQTTLLIGMESVFAGIRISCMVLAERVFIRSVRSNQNIRLYFELFTVKTRKSSQPNSLAPATSFTFLFSNFLASLSTLRTHCSNFKRSNEPLPFTFQMHPHKVVLSAVCEGTESPFYSVVFRLKSLFFSKNMCWTVWPIVVVWRIF